jgi:prevent-host-death family protein
LENPTQEIDAFEATSKLAGLLDRVEKGEEIVITRHGRAVARLVPEAGGVDRTAARAAADRIRSRATALKIKPGFNWGDLKADRDLGRP